ncbi:regulatory protein GemA [Methylocaldum sp.]|uniref:gp16 family protein n=1 Tax=Methylocaldum sp. TaxID=1969727 RepID=UPI002D5B58C0|nr:regulatory protein GemA [Methylocaldum sp.]HYE35478.1 regulatory protein GemA [Methylocaldum sp.]
MSADDRARLIRLIHIGKGQLRLEDEVYREMLRSTTGLTSTTEMRVHQLEDVLARMKSLGFKVRVPKAKGEQRRLAHAPQDRKIRALWLALHEAGAVRDPSEAALNAWVKRETGIEALQWADEKQAAKLIDKLKQWAKRLEKPVNPQTDRHQP